MKLYVISCETRTNDGILQFSPFSLMKNGRQTIFNNSSIKSPDDHIRVGVAIRNLGQLDKLDIGVIA